MGYNNTIEKHIPSNPFPHAIIGDREASAEADDVGGGAGTCSQKKHQVGTRSIGGRDKIEWKGKGDAYVQPRILCHHSLDTNSHTFDNGK